MCEAWLGVLIGIHFRIWKCTLRWLIWSFLQHILHPGIVQIRVCVCVFVFMREQVCQLWSHVAPHLQRTPETEDNPWKYRLTNMHAHTHTHTNTQTHKQTHTFYTFPGGSKGCVQSLIPTVLLWAHTHSHTPTSFPALWPLPREEREEFSISFIILYIATDPCISKTWPPPLPWKPDWLCRRPELSGTPSWQPLFSSCRPAEAHTEHRTTEDHYKVLL